MEAAPAQYSYLIIIIMPRAPGLQTDPTIFSSWIFFPK